MLNLFRTIRRSLINGKISNRYFLYALGEVALIIVGVLIALSAAEWDNNRKNKTRVQKSLIEINKQLNIDLEYLEFEIDETRSAVNRISMLDSLLKGPQPSLNDRSLDSLYGAVYGLRSFALESTNYEDLKSSGLNTIEDDSLRRQLILVFERGLFTNLLELELSTLELTRSFYLENFSDLHFRRSATPLDLPSLWQSSYYKNLVNYRLNYLKAGQTKLFTSLRSEIIKLIRLIEDFLESKNKD